MTVTRASCLFAAGGFAAALGIVVTGQQPAATAVYTLEQAAAGRSAYDVNCRACHLPDLGGVNEAPQLAGGNFMTTWRERTAADLITRIDQTMPPTNPDAVSQAMATDLAAFILQANGATPGTQRLVPTTMARIGDVGMRQTPPVRAAAPAEAAAAPAAAAAQPKGLTVVGEVPNYVPVTDDDAPEPAARRLADGATQLPGLELQPAEPDHARQREEPEARVGLGHERGRREPADARRAQRHSLPGAYGQHRAGAERPRWRVDLGVPRGTGATATPCGTWRSTRTSCS